MNGHVLPEGWREARLGSIGTFKNGINKSKEAFGKGVPFVNLLDVFGRSAMHNPKLGLVEVSKNEMEAYNLNKGDVLFVRSSVKPEGVGLTCVLLNDLPETVYSGFLIRFRMKEKILEEAFCKHCFHSHYFRKALIRKSSVSANTNINQQSLEKLLLLVPPLAEQKAIAEILQTWDAAIEKTESLIAAKEKRFKGLVARLIKKSGIHKEKLEGISESNSGGTPLSTMSEYYGGGIPWVSIADMTEKGMWINSTSRTLTKAGLKNSSAKIYPKNTVLYAMYASIGECSIAAVELTSSQAILGIRPNADKLHFEYLYYYLNSLKEKIKLQGQWGTQSNLNAEIVRNFKIPLPPLAEQKRVAAILNTARREIDILRKLGGKYRAQKRGIMQKLLTGKWRTKTKGG